MWQAIENLFSAFNLQMGLLVGTGILAISLIVLALTRWGQSSPVWKCVILSFAAHILLIVYAHGTHLISENTDPLPPGKENLRVNLIASAEDLKLETELVKAVPDWSQDSIPADLPDVVEALERPEIDSEIVIERVKSAPAVVPEVENSTVLPAPVETVEIQKVAEVPLDVNSGFKVAERDPTRLDSPEIPVERKKRSEATMDEPPLFIEPRDVAEIEKQNDFQSHASDLENFNPHPGGLDSTWIDPNSQFAKSDSTPLLPLPSMDANPILPPLVPEKMEAIFRKARSSSRASDGKPLPPVYSLRNAVDREQIVAQRGGSPETEAAVKAALGWLAGSQEPDGRWDADRWGAGIERQVLGHDRKGAGADADTGITGLAALALLAGGHTHLEGAYQENVKRALDFMMLKQRPNGDLGGEAKLFARTYCHSMALLALSEALAVTGDVRLMSAVQKGVDFSVQSQNRDDGGWRYQPGDSGDMSQHGWQVLALQSAKLGGARIPDVTFERMKIFVENCSSGSYGGLSSYRPRQGVSTAMTAEALVCRFILQDTVSYSTMMEAARRISTERPTSLHINLYYWYYGTLALYQVGGNDWELWNAELKKALLSTQVTFGPAAGSWAPDCIWGGYGGRVYSTALGALNLQVYYRYMPKHRSAAIIDTPDEIIRR
jgi:hypothetical protein